MALRCVILTIRRQLFHRSAFIGHPFVCCTAIHHAVGVWLDDDTLFENIMLADTQREAQEWRSGARDKPIVWIILTIAHLVDMDVANVDDSNLGAYCQRHHNRLDAKMRSGHAQETNRAKLVTAGQRELALGASHDDVSAGVSNEAPGLDAAAPPSAEERRIARRVPALRRRVERHEMGDGDAHP
jgi:hypothetical protein